MSRAPLDTTFDYYPPSGVYDVPAALPTIVGKACRLVPQDRVLWLMYPEDLPSAWVTFDDEDGVAVCTYVRVADGVSVVSLLDAGFLAIPSGSPPALQALFTTIVVPALGDPYFRVFVGTRPFSFS